MNKAFFGGSFDPPHVGHVLSVSAALSTTDVDQIIVTPSGNHPTKDNELSFEHRFEMARKAFSHFDASNVTFSTVERNMENETYTVDVIDKMYPKPNSLLCGTDILSDLALGVWSRYKEFLSKIDTIYYVIRDETSHINLRSHVAKIKQQGVSVKQVYAPFTSSISSTKVRARFRNSRKIPSSITHFAPKSVMDYILKHDLYEG